MNYAKRWLEKGELWFEYDNHGAGGGQSLHPEAPEKSRVISTAQVYSMEWQLPIAQSPEKILPPSLIVQASPG